MKLSSIKNTLLRRVGLIVVTPLLVISLIVAAPFLVGWTLMEELPAKIKKAW